MEIYNPKKHTSEPSTTPSNQPIKGSIFPERALNKGLPFYVKISFFLIGFLGLQLFSILVQLFISLFLSPDEDRTLFLSLLNFFTYLLTAIGMLSLLSFEPHRGIKILGKEFLDKKAYGYAAIGLFAIYLVNIIFSLLYSMIPYYGSNANQDAVESMTASQPVLLFFTTVIFAPFCEELTYRVGLGDTIGRKNPWLGIILSSLIFGLIHFDFNSISNVISSVDTELYEANLINLYNELLNLPIYVFSGAVLCSTYFFSGRLSSSMSAHLCNNLLSFIVSAI